MFDSLTRKSEVLVIYKYIKNIFHIKTHKARLKKSLSNYTYLLLFQRNHVCFSGHISCGSQYLITSALGGSDIPGHPGSLNSHSYTQTKHTHWCTIKMKNKVHKENQF